MQDADILQELWECRGRVWARDLYEKVLAKTVAPKGVFGLLYHMFWGSTVYAFYARIRRLAKRGSIVVLRTEVRYLDGWPIRAPVIALPE